MTLYSYRSSTDTASTEIAGLLWFGRWTTGIREYRDVDASCMEWRETWTLWLIDAGDQRRGGGYVKIDFQFECVVKERYLTTGQRSSKEALRIGQPSLLNQYAHAGGPSVFGRFKFCLKCLSRSAVESFSVLTLWWGCRRRCCRWVWVVEAGIVVLVVIVVVTYT